MADLQIQLDNLPPGWDCKYDNRTGKYYFINLFNKTTTWDDPRARHRHLHGSGSGSGVHASSEYIPLQSAPVHGSPYHVYPASNYPVQQAFQNPPSSTTASPLFSTKMQQIEMSPLSRSIPHTPRMGQLARQQNIQETSFTTAAETDAVVAKINTMFPTVSETHIRLLLKKYYNREAVVISALQVEKHPLTTPGPYTTPPPPGRHFHNTAMGVLSATAFQMTPSLGRDTSSSRTGSPLPRPGSCASGSYGYGSPNLTYRSSPKPHSSPKMKLRYLKSLFQKAEETFILDILAGSDNNVQKATEKLLKMGYEKRDISAPRLSLRKSDDKKEDSSATPVPKVKSFDDRKKLKARLQTQYKDIAERIISMALESVDYSEDRAVQILNIVIQEDKDKKKSSKTKENVESKENVEASTSRSSSTTSASKQQQKQQQNNKEKINALENKENKKALAQKQKKKTAADDDSNSITTIKTSNTSTTLTANTTSTTSATTPETATISPSSSSSTTSPSSTSSHDGKLKQNRLKAKNDHSKNTADDQTDTSTNNKADEFKSALTRRAVNGPNASLYKGPNDELLLADYVTWTGANPELSKGRKGMANGTDLSMRSSPGGKYTNRGPNSDLCKGPKVGLAKGSMYSQINRPMTNVICN